MAKEIQTRLPQPQKTLTTTYSAPNPIAPQRPQRLPEPLPYDDSLASAGMRLADSLFQYTLGEKKRDMDLIEQKEAIRIANLEQDELEGELKKLALEAEGINPQVISNNPFRIKVAMENIADRMMRGSYGATLEEATNRFADPLNPDSDSEATQFALDAFQGLNIQGFWAQDRAAKMYTQMSSNWLGNVRTKKKTRLDAMAHDDVQDIAFRALTDWSTNSITTPWEDVVTRMNEGAEEGHSITGMSMRDDLVAGVKRFMHQQAVVAANDGDGDEIEKLLSALDAIEEIKSGPMNLSEQQAAELGDIRVILDNAKERAGDQDREDIERDTKSAIDMGNTWIIKQTMAGEGLPVDITNPAVQSLRDEMEAADLSGYAIDNYFSEYFLPKVNAYISGGRKPDPDELDRVLSEIGGKDVTADGRRAIIDASTLPEVTKSGLRDQSLRRARDETMIQKMLLVDPNTGQARTSLANNANANAIAAKIAVDDGGADPETAASLQTFLDEYVQNAGRAAAQKTYATEELRSEAIEAAISTATGVISAVRLDSGADYDINGARKHGMPEHIIQEMLEITRSKALLDLGIARVDIEGLEGADKVALFGGNLMRRAIFDYADNIHQIYTNVINKPGASALSRAGAKTKIDNWVAEMQTDAAGFVEEIRSGDGATKVSGKLLGFSSYRITPKGILTYSGSMLRPVEDSTLTNDLLQAERILGLTDKEMRSGVTKSGLAIEHFDILKDPYRTGHIPVEGFEDDLAQIADINTPAMLQEELLGKLSGNGIAEGYNAYVEMVGVNDAVGFNDFLRMQLHGIGRHRLPVPDAAVLKRMDMNITDTTP